MSEVMLRGAAINYAGVAELDPAHPNWRRYWRKLHRAAIGMVAEILEAAGSPEGIRAPRRAGPGAVELPRRVSGERTGDRHGELAGDDVTGGVHKTRKGLEAHPCQGRARPLGSKFSGEARAHV